MAIVTPLSDDPDVRVALEALLAVAL
jgi:hypothetical protein